MSFQTRRRFIGCAVLLPAITACRSNDMEDFERALSELVASRTDDEEAAAARRLAQLARDRRATLELVARDLTTGRTVAIADLLSHRGGPLSIELVVDVRGRVARQWTPRQVAHVLLLLGE